MIRAFTGPTKLDEEQFELVEDFIRGLDGEPDEVRTGCAHGVDTIACNMQWFDFPHATHKLYVPAAYHNERHVEWFEPNGNVEIIHCPKRESAASSYRRRNEMMVTGADELIAFVYRGTYYRSGEWMTIKIARKQGVTVQVFVIGSYQPEKGRKIENQNGDGDPAACRRPPDCRGGGRLRQAAHD
jgi:hypothetical protein